MIAVVILVGQGLLAVALLLAVNTFGVYTDKLTKTHQQNLEIRLRLAQQQNEFAIHEILKREKEA
jgi:hypothetical protein